ncbi:hypothetical protein L1049_008637 [Liquidambar formosana]|uniref:Disease resistance protein RGA3 n=1 Tax=Liquidambar formosana TaxID=63359 RepID=A0AAP0X5R9_LIQFO
MGETFAFNVADKVLGKLGSFALEEVCLAWGLESELEKLKSTISTIQSVLLDAEEKQAKNRQLRNWLGKLKDALYDADDVLDEFHYEALRSQGPNRGGIKGEVRHLFARSNPLAFRFKMGHKIEGIRQRFKEIAAEKADFHLTEQVFDRGVIHGEREMTHSFVLASDVIGRDDDKENIVELLMLQVDGENVSVIPIVGIGGLGKTTLTKLVYNDERVVEHFELRMWICVSENFDVTKLTKEIIKSAKPDENCNDLTIDLLQSCLRRTLDNKMFLLILDDVWNNDRDKWIELKIFLIGGARGSKIVVTTQSQSIASFMGTTINPYNLKGLPHEECLSLFAKWAFNEGEEKLYPNLLKIGEEIVKKCGGVPLAIKTLGSLLYSKRNDECEWTYVKDNEIWKLPQKETEILPALKLSYDAMPPHLKAMFFFLFNIPKRS